MPNEYSGEAVADEESCFAIVVSQYNETITRRLLDGALGTLRQARVEEENIDVFWVPGAWELPVIASQLAHSDRYEGILCLGAVIRGETTHDQYINQQVSQSLGQIALETAVPILFGVLTCNTLEQALQRAGGNQGNKGAECAEAALKMANLIKKLP